MCESNHVVMVSDRRILTIPRHNPVNAIVRERSGFKYPIKIIFVMEDEILTVVTVYPFKKGNQK